MNEKQKIEIDELITLLIDGEQTERQKTELKRLVRHDEAVKERFYAVYRQKKFLSALPVEKAPSTLVNDVTAAIERKNILSTFDRDEQGVYGSRHLLLRRVLTTAAMFLLPLGLLAWVVFQILKPVSQPTGTDAPIVSLIPPQRSGVESIREPVGELIRSMPFDAILTFQTDQHITVSNFVEKAIYDQGLTTAMLPNRTVDVTTYQVTASPEKIAALVDSIDSLWIRCDTISLAVLDDAGNESINIENIRPAQIKMLAEKRSSAELRQVAGQIQLSNASQDTLLADGGIEKLPDLGVPMLTGREEPTPSVADFSVAKVRLRIHVKRKMD